MSDCVCGDVCEECRYVPDRVPPTKWQVTAIIMASAREFGVKPELVVSRTRTVPVIRARNAACWRFKKRWPWLPLKTIGRHVGGLHHSSVIHALYGRNNRRSSKIQVAEKRTTE